MESSVEGTRVSPEEAILLFEQADLLDLAEVADKIRIRRHPDNVISYIIDRQYQLYERLQRVLHILCLLSREG
jgi:2-iminoacetate synthase ThiH